MDDDAELLQLYVRERSEKAFSALVQRHLRAVYAVVLRRVGGDSHLAEEATQDVFAALSRKASSLSTERSVAGWLFVSARFASSKIARREYRKRSVPLNEELPPTAEAEPDWSELRPLLDDLIQNLNTADREALLLRFYEDRSFAEIGEVLRLSENTARMRVTRAIEKLREKLQRKGIASTAVALAAGLAEQASAAVPPSLSASVASTAVTTTAAISTPLLTFMALTKTQTAVLAAMVASGAAFVGIKQHEAIGSLRAQLTTQETALTDARKQLSEISGKLAVSEMARQKILADKTGNNDVAANSTRPNDAADVIVLHMKDVMRDHPEIIPLQRRQFREMTMAQYYNAIERLHLPEGEVSKLKDLLVERDTAGSDAAEIARQQGAPNNSPEMNKATKDATGPIDAEIKSLIGVAAADTLEGLRGNTNFSWTTPNFVALNLYDQQRPLTTEATSQLQQLYYETNSSNQNPDAKDPSYNRVDQSSWLSKADDSFLSKASGILTPAQIEIAKATIADHNHYSNILGQYNKNNVAMMIVP